LSVCERVIQRQRQELANKERKWLRERERTRRQKGKGERLKYSKAKRGSG